MIDLTKFFVMALDATAEPSAMDKAAKVVDQMSGFVWNNILLFVLLGAGLYFTVRTGFVQIRHFGRAWNRVFGDFSLSGSKAGKDGMSSFQALATAIAAQVGTGNIAGCATAIVGGGPGAIFWMWLAAFFGMATIYGEACMAQATKIVDKNGEVTGGPVYYITKAFKGGFGKFLAAFFSVAIILALGFMGNMVQSNSISDAFKTAFGIPAWIIGIAVAVIAAFIFLGGIGRIASFTEKCVPIMAALYLIGGFIILIINYKNNKASDEIKCSHYRYTFLCKGSNTADTTKEDKCCYNRYCNTYNPSRNTKCCLKCITYRVRLNHVTHEAKCKDNSYREESSKELTESTLKCLSNIVNRTTCYFSVLINYLGCLSHTSLAVDCSHTKEGCKPHPEDCSRTTANYSCSTTGDITGSNLCCNCSCKCLE